jgi:hypothetical protein
MHALWLAAFDEIGGVAVADKQRLQLFMTDAGEDSRVVDLVPIEMQHRQHRAIGDRVEKLVAVPAGGERARLRLAVADHHQRDQIRVVVNSAVGVRDAVAELAALVDAAGCFGRGMAADAARKGELLEEALQSCCIFALLRIDLRVHPLEIRRDSTAGAPCPGPLM